MAEEKAEEKKDADEQPAVAGSKKKLILLVGVAVAVLAGGGGGGLVFPRIKLRRRGEGSGEKSDHGEAEHKEPGPVMDLDPFLVNLADHERLRYLKLSIKLELDRPEEETDLKKNSLPFEMSCLSY